MTTSTWVQGAQGLQELKAREHKMIYMAWNIWKERCRRVFYNKALPPNKLQALIQSEVRLCHLAREAMIEWSPWDDCFMLLSFFLL
jgi:hypothetical protein